MNDNLDLFNSSLNIQALRKCHELSLLSSELYQQNLSTCNVKYSTNIDLESKEL